MHANPTDDEMRQLLIGAGTIAMVGASSDPEKSSHGIMRKLQQVGYRVIPVNPRETEVLGEIAYGSLEEIPDPVDIVDVFRRAEDTPAIADQAVRTQRRRYGPDRTSNEEAARAEAGGCLVMDTCIAVTHTLPRVPRRNEGKVNRT